MLVISRSIGEQLFINKGEIKLRILDIRGNQVRLGIQAPKYIQIHREEAYKPDQADE